MSVRLKNWRIAPVLALFELFAPAARAYEAEVNASVDAQFYTLRSPYGDPIVRRRRYTENLGVAVYGLQGDYVPGEPELSFRARMRLDADFGQDDRERDVSQAAYFIPGLEQTPLDIMYGYLEGRNYLGGLFGFRLGRQYTTDALGFWSFDGAVVTLTTPVFVRVEALAGFEQRGGLPLSSPRWEADGVFRGDRRDLELNQWPSFLKETKLAPAVGVAVESAGLTWLSSRLSYRRVTNRDTVVVSPFTDANGRLATFSGERVSSEKLGYALRASVPDLGSISGHAVYDLYAQLVSDYLLSIDWRASERLSFGAQYDYYVPTFDADSIWNWFTHGATTTAEARTSVRLSRRFDAALNLGVRAFQSEGSPSSYATTGDRSESGRRSDWLARLNGRYAFDETRFALQSLLETGKDGHRAGADLTTTRWFDGGTYDALAILSVYDFRDNLRPDRGGTSFTYVLGGGFSPSQRTRMGLEWEHTCSELVGQRFRLLATLDLTVLQ